MAKNIRLTDQLPNLPAQRQRRNCRVTSIVNANRLNGENGGEGERNGN
jgi:hypothetical protein